MQLQNCERAPRIMLAEVCEVLAIAEVNEWLAHNYCYSEETSLV